MSSPSKNSFVQILGAARTPIGALQGTLASISGPQLGAVALQAAIARSGIDPQKIQSVFMGQVLQAGAKQAPARQAARAAGLAIAANCTTVNKVCGSGMQALIFGAQNIRLGEASFAAVGGMESMSSAPYLVRGVRSGLRSGNHTLIDSIFEDGLIDSDLNISMGKCAEECAAKYQISRAEQDEYAAESFRRANRIHDSIQLNPEIAPVAVGSRKGESLSVDRDEGPAKVIYEKIPKLKPAFQDNGTITAANASTLSDGAAALVIGSAEAAEQNGLSPVARVVAWASHSQEPLWFSTAPIAAAQKALKVAGWRTDDVDLWEVNEAFAVVPIAFSRELQVSLDRINVRGGAIALGHPLGASGARIIVTLIEALRAAGKRRGLAAICIGGGEGLAVAIEMISPDE